jgi:hypothetical protein
MDRLMVKTVLILTLIVSGCSGTAKADAFGYAEKRELKVTSKHYIIIHVHDWSEATRSTRFKMISTHQNPFTAENNYAYIKCIEKATGKLLFKKPCPALTRLEISPDEQYIVGLSDVKLWNPYQLVIFSTKGVLVKKRSFTGDGVALTKAEEKENQLISANFSESVTNWIYWFYEKDPKIQFYYKGTKLEAISLLDPKRKRIRISVG